MKLQNQTFFKKILGLILFVSFCLPALAKQEAPLDLKQKYPVGEGAKYELDLGKGSTVTVYMYTARAQKEELWIEMAFDGKAAGVPLQLWQQAHLRVFPKIQAQAGYMWTPQMSSVEKFDLSQAAKGNGFDLSNFMLADEAALKKYFVKKEKVIVGKKELWCSKYERISNGKKVEFWIHPQVKPFGLVKLQTPNGNTKVTLLLKNKVQGVKAKIDPTTAKPLSALGKVFLGLQQGL